ncbi:Cytochrome c-type biogenesis protein CcmH [Methylocystis sp. MJC1]|nr:Cytochrome c-type biogenesis protein CcmH [Methylocystis sp. MJC1]
MMWKAPSLSLPHCRGRGDAHDRRELISRGDGNLAPSPAGGRLARRPSFDGLWRGRAGVGAVAMIALLFITPAHAVTPGEMLPDPAMEARARAITSELRCLVCQNQSVDDSDASLAKDLRVLVREKLKDGLSDAEVKEYVHSRYGDFVLLRPPLKLETILLWTAPLLALLAGAAAVWIASRRRAPASSIELTAEERARLEALGLSDTQGPDQSM